MTDAPSYCPPDADCPCFERMAAEIKRLQALNLELAASRTKSHNEAVRLRRQIIAAATALKEA